MSIYEPRIDHRTLSAEDQEFLQRIERELAEETAKNRASSGLEFVSSGSSVRARGSRAIRAHISQFPNNYLDPGDLGDKDKLRAQLKSFRELLDAPTTGERAILNHIRDQRPLFVVACLLRQEYNTGHHDAFLFREFKLGSQWQADFLLIGRSSGGHDFVWVELESPKDEPPKKVVAGDGTFGAIIRDGIKQVHDWRRTIQASFPTIAQDLERMSNKPLEQDLRTLDLDRHHFVVVAGRRQHFQIADGNSYDERRRLRRTEDVLVIHYDRLLDNAERWISAAHTY
ncbi:MAG: hypothetical protein HYV07_06905 [Deltaproteobacteria bacterium]|nr:hypothetical protein [Deltaproteobacteria bacterium]